MKRFSPIQIALMSHAQSRLTSDSELVNTSVSEPDSLKCKSARSTRNSSADTPRRDRADRFNECARTSLLAISRFRSASTVEEPAAGGCDERPRASISSIDQLGDDRDERFK